MYNTGRVTTNDYSKSLFYSGHNYNLNFTAKIGSRTWHVRQEIPMDDGIDAQTHVVAAGIL